MLFIDFSSAFNTVILGRLISKLADLGLFINRDCVERDPVFKFLGTHIPSDPSWTTNTTAAVKKAQQRLHFLRILKQNHLQEKLLVSFYHCSIESVLTYCISAWYAN